MIKILGAILILSASICACVFYEKRQKEQLSSIIECNDLIQFIKSQIEYFSTPIEKIFNLYSKESSHSAVTKSIIENRLESIKDLFDMEDFSLINEFFSTLGMGVKTEQLALCSYTIEELEKAIKKKKAELPEKIKVFRAMALFIGICIIILLI